MEEIEIVPIPPPSTSISGQPFFSNKENTFPNRDMRNKFHNKSELTNKRQSQRNSSTTNERANVRGRRTCCITVHSPRGASRTRSVSRARKGIQRSKKRSYSTQPLQRSRSNSKIRSRSSSCTRTNSRLQVTKIRDRKNELTLGTALEDLPSISHVQQSGAHHIGNGATMDRGDDSNESISPMANPNFHHNDVFSKSIMCMSMLNSPNLPGPIRTRHLLTASVYHNRQTDIWITTINMSQKEAVTKSNAAKYLKAFSFPTEHEARESAYANAPAQMIPFDESPHCFTCDARFSIFRRASHCRNCGVCICNSCSNNWNKVCIPETYNIKNESTVKVCRSCNTLSRMFRSALLDGKYENAITIYNSGNINLRCPFATTSKGEESMLPIHCAVEGGSLELLQWLVDVHFCPIKRIRTKNGRTNAQNTDVLITTSKGRSVVDIAVKECNVEILRYLVNEKNASVTGIKDLNLALNALEAVLKTAPPTLDTPLSLPPGLMTDLNTPKINDGLPTFEISGEDCAVTDEESSCSEKKCEDEDQDDQSVATTVRDAVSNRKSCHKVHFSLFQK